MHTLYSTMDGLILPLMCGKCMCCGYDTWLHCHVTVSLHAYVCVHGNCMVMRIVCVCVHVYTRVIKLYTCDMWMYHGLSHTLWNMVRVSHDTIWGACFTIICTSFAIMRQAFLR